MFATNSLQLDGHPFPDVKLGFSVGLYYINSPFPLQAKVWRRFSINMAPQIWITVTTLVIAFRPLIIQITTIYRDVYPNTFVLNSSYSVLCFSMHRWYFTIQPQGSIIPIEFIQFIHTSRALIVFDAVIHHRCIQTHCALCCFNL